MDFETPEAPRDRAKRQQRKKAMGRHAGDESWHFVRGRVQARDASPASCAAIALTLGAPNAFCRSFAALASTAALYDGFRHGPKSRVS